MSNKNEKLDKLIIDNVDLALLEEQRRWLGSVLDRDGEKREQMDFLLVQSEKDALIGLESMLNHWSDKIWADKNGCNSFKPDIRRGDSHGICNSVIK